MASATLPIRGSVLRWAREQDGLTPGELAKRIRVDSETVVAWERGTRTPSKGEFSRLVAALKRPRAMFFLPSPPKESGVLVALRKAPGLADHELLSVELRQLRWARRIQELVASLRAENQKPALPRVDARHQPKAVAKLIRAFLEVKIEDQLNWREPYLALREWRSAAENKSILVLQLQLGSEGIRGFCLSDEIAPLVGINTAYNESARIFTLMHELAHLVSGNASACSLFIGPAGSGLEKWCEEVASYVLLPPDDFEEEVARMFNTSDAEFDFEKTRAIARRFSVSLRAVALRLIKAELADSTLYAEIDRHAKVTDRPIVRGGGKGAPRAERRFTQLGQSVPDSVLRGLDRGSLSTRTALDVLRIHLAELDDMRSLLRKTRE